MKKRLYLCGPITGMPNYNRDAFNDAESALRSAGFDVFNPVHLERAGPRLGRRITKPELLLQHEHPR